MSNLVLEIENIIDKCNDYLDGEAPGVEITLPILARHTDGTMVVGEGHSVCFNEKKIKNIRAMAYALRSALYQE